jgi:two-component system, LuxR family, response regulator FixJ
MSHHRTVYVIDRDLDTRRNLASHLGSIGAETWPFAQGAELLAILDHLMPGCILLDLDSPLSLDILRELAERRPAWPIVALSGREDVALAVEAMKLGALDFLVKPVDAAALEDALAPAWETLEISVEESEVRRDAQERVARLTAREVDISLALLGGRPNKMVAHEFGISVRTVEMHRAHIMAKLGVRNLAEAAVLATRAGLVAAPGAPLSGPRDAPPPNGTARLLLSRPRPDVAPRFVPRRFSSRSAY